MSALDHMLPTLPMGNVVDLRLGNAKLAGNCALAHASGEQPSYLTNLFRVKFRGVNSLTNRRSAETCRMSVARVFLRCNPLKIAHMVIKFVSVDVVYFMEGRGRGSNERLSHNTMGHTTPAFPAILHVYDSITAVGQALLHFLRLDGHSRWAADEPLTATGISPRDCPYSSMGRNLMGQLEADNRLPNFLHHISPSTAMIRAGIHTRLHERNQYFSGIFRS